MKDLLDKFRKIPNATEKDKVENEKEIARLKSLHQKGLDYSTSLVKKESHFAGNEAAAQVYLEVYDEVLEWKEDTKKMKEISKAIRSKLKVEEYMVVMKFRKNFAEEFGEPNIDKLVHAMDEDDGVDNSHIDLAKKIEELGAWGDTKECLDKIAETDTKNLHELLKKGEKTPEGFEDMIREILMALGQQASARKTPAELVAVLVDIDRKRFEELIAKEKAKREECQQEYTNAKAANIETGLAVDNFVASVKNRKELLEEIAASIASLQQKMSLNAPAHLDLLAQRKDFLLSFNQMFFDGVQMPEEKDLEGLYDKVGRLMTAGALQTPETLANSLIMKKEAKTMTLPDGILQMMVMDHMLAKPIKAAINSGSAEMTQDLVHAFFQPFGIKIVVQSAEITKSGFLSSAEVTSKLGEIEVLSSDVSASSGEEEEQQEEPTQSILSALFLDDTSSF